VRGVKQITPNLHQLPLGATCVFLVMEERITVIDAGRKGSSFRILEYLEHLGRSGEEISYIIPTHYHLDHIGGIAHLQQTSGARVAVYQSEAPFVRRKLPLPSPFHNPALAFLMSPFLRLSQPPYIEVDQCLADGDRLEALGGMEVIHTPGHTPGSISLYFKQHGILIVGDALEFRRGRLGLPSRLFTTDMAQAKESIRRLARLEFETLCFSHFPPLRTGASQAMRNFAGEID